jgi:polysaccharide biosynthesis/export protein
MAGVLALMLAQAPAARAQAELETQQKVNERIQELAKNTAAHTPAQDYVVGRGDVMAVEVFEVPELTRDVRVSQTGTIGLPLLPVRLFVAGLTEEQIQQKVAEVLEANGLVSHPQVMVFVKERRSKPIAVVGAVGHPMVVQADHPISLVEVLANAGGLAPDAGDVVIITRGGMDVAGSSASEPPEIGPEDPVPAANPSSPAPPAPGSAAAAQPSPGGARVEGTASQDVPPEIKADTTEAKHAPVTTAVGAVPTPSPDASAQGVVPPAINNAEPPQNLISVNLSELLEKGETQNNIGLLAGDVVTVPHAGVVYALGAVGRPGAFVSNNDRAQLSTLKVLALAGGVTRVAKKSEAVIIRKDAQGHQLAIPVDLGKIVKRQTEDVRMLPSDILYVPDSHAKAALLRAGEIVLGVGTSLVVYRLGTQ